MADQLAGQWFVKASDFPDSDVSRFQPSEMYHYLLVLCIVIHAVCNNLFRDELYKWEIINISETGAFETATWHFFLMRHGAYLQEEKYKRHDVS